MARPATIRVTPIAPALGAEITGVDLTADLCDDQVSALRAAWLDHLVLFFRDQPLTPERFLRFAATIGRPVEYPFVRGIPGYPEIIEVKKLPHETVNFGGIWHTDTAYLAEPPMASLLLAREVPSSGGDTLFANMYAAYDALSDPLKLEVAGLVGVNSSAKADVSRTREDRIASDGRVDAGQEHLAEHPVVRTHPETGRKSLYVNVAHTVRFRGMSEAESAPLLETLFAHQTRPEFTCRFRWQPGSLALWDNRCTLHYPVNDYPGRRRVMHRITLAGTRPR